MDYSLTMQMIKDTFKATVCTCIFITVMGIVRLPVSNVMLGIVIISLFAFFYRRDTEVIKKEHAWIEMRWSKKEPERVIVTQCMFSKYFFSWLTGGLKADSQTALMANLKVVRNGIEYGKKYRCVTHGDIVEQLKELEKRGIIKITNEEFEKKMFPTLYYYLHQLLLGLKPKKKEGKQILFYKIEFVKA